VRTMSPKQAEECASNRNEDSPNIPSELVDATADSSACTNGKRLGHRRHRKRSKNSLHGTSYCQSAETQMKKLLSILRPREASHRHRRQIYEYIRGLIQTAFPKAGAVSFMYGSVPLRTYLPDGDLDVGACMPTPHVDEWFKRLEELLKRESGKRRDSSAGDIYAVQTVVLVNAEIKLIKCIVNGVLVDLSANTLGAMAPVQLFDAVDKKIGKRHLFKRSVLILKAWSTYESRILASHQSLLSTYALQVMLLYVINLRHGEIGSPLQALACFLEVFSKFDWENYGVSVTGKFLLRAEHTSSNSEQKRTKGSVNDTKDGNNHSNEGINTSASQSSSGEKAVNNLEKETPVGETSLLLGTEFFESMTHLKKFAGHTQLRKPKAPFFLNKYLNIRDPLDPLNNLGRSVNLPQYYRICEAFKKGNRQLHAALEELESAKPAPLKIPLASSPRSGNVDNRDGDGIPGARPDGKKMRGLFSCFWKNTLKKLKQSPGILEVAEEFEPGRFSPGFSPFASTNISIFDEKGTLTNRARGNAPLGEYGNSIASTPSSTNESLEAVVSGGVKYAGAPDPIRLEESKDDKQLVKKHSGGNLDGQVAQSDSSLVTNNLRRNTQTENLNHGQIVDNGLLNVAKNDQENHAAKTEKTVAISNAKEDYPHLSSLNAPISRFRNEECKGNSEFDSAEIKQTVKAFLRSKPRGVWGTAKLSAAQRLRRAAEKERKEANDTHKPIATPKGVNEFAENRKGMMSSQDKTKNEEKGSQNCHRESTEEQKHRNSGVSTKTSDSVASPNPMSWTWHNRLSVTSTEIKAESESSLRTGRSIVIDQSMKSENSRASKGRIQDRRQESNSRDENENDNHLDEGVESASVAAQVRDLAQNQSQFESNEENISEGYLDFSSDTKGFAEQMSFLQKTWVDMAPKGDGTRDNAETEQGSEEKSAKEGREIKDPKKGCSRRSNSGKHHRHHTRNGTRNGNTQVMKKKNSVHSVPIEMTRIYAQPPMTYGPPVDYRFPQPYNSFPPGVQGEYYGHPYCHDHNIRGRGRRTRDRGRRGRGKHDNHGLRRHGMWAGHQDYVYSMQFPQSNQRPLAHMPRGSRGYVQHQRGNVRMGSTERGTELENGMRFAHPPPNVYRHVQDRRSNTIGRNASSGSNKQKKKREGGPAFVRAAKRDISGFLRNPPKAETKDVSAADDFKEKMAKEDVNIPPERR